VLTHVNALNGIIVRLLYIHLFFEGLGRGYSLEPVGRPFSVSLFSLVWDKLSKILVAFNTYEYL